ncbi:MAG TPA: class I SAM-dependent methyltransferase [Patescibacteria group bacterium]|nr:class I SAM-dependent methyltransferase [Patescibacteria group bacterium]
MKNFWNKFTDQFGNTILHPQFIMLSYTREALVEILKYSKNKKLIDLGCGRMEYREILQTKLKKYIGVDHPKVSLLYNPQNKPDILADISKEIPVPNKSFDIAICLEVFEYLENPSKTFSEINRILKQNGILILTIPFMYPLHDVPYDRYRFSESELKLLLKNNKFKIKKIKANGNFLGFWFQSLNAFLVKRIFDILKSKKNILLTIYLIFLLLITPEIVIFTNILFSVSKNINLNFPNYFPLDYLVVATKY